MVAGTSLRFAVVGDPIQHSLSPALAILTAAHLSGEGVEVEFTDVAWIESDRIEMAMSWAMTGSGPTIRPSRFESDLLSMRVAAAEVVKEVTEAPVSWGFSGVHPSLYGGAPSIVHSEQATWLSITSPLKHQLGPRSGVECADDSLLISSVNQLIWSGSRWSGGSSDGAGIVRLARERGLFSAGEESPILVMRGGGASARSGASAWSAAGGRIEPLPGRRPLDHRGPWGDSILETNQSVRTIAARVTVDYDSNPGQPTPPGTDFQTAATVHLSAAYRRGADATPKRNIDGALSLDGRWLLAAQQLEAWARFVRPDAALSLPSLDLTVARLQAFEDRLPN